MTMSCGMKDQEMSMSSGAVFKRCACTEPVLAPDGQPIVDSAGAPKRRQLGAKCAQLRRPDGSWSRRHGAWYYQLELQAIPGDGRTQIKRGGFDSQNSAREALTKVTRIIAIAEDADQPGLARARIVELIRASERDAQDLPTDEELRRRIVLGRNMTERVTVGDWLNEWLDSKGNLRASTRRSYRGHLDLYLIPYLGSTTLDRLTVQHVNRMFTALKERNARIEDANAVLADARAEIAAAPGALDENHTQEIATGQQKLRRPEGRVVKEATQQRIRATLRTALSDAAAQGLISTNVARLVKLPSGRRPKALVWTDERVARWRVTGNRPSAVMVWTPAQTIQFLHATKSHPLSALFYLIVHTGLRRGEAVGLRWSDLNLDASNGRASMTISQQIIQLGWETEVGEPKSDAGERQVALDRAAVDVLNAHREKQNGYRQLLAGAWVDSDLVFSRTNGSARHPAEVTDAFTQASREAGLPPIRLHDLRHGTATHALSAGVDIKVVQEMLGHSSSTITRDTYTSVLDDAKHAAAAAISGLLSPRETSLPDPGTK